MNIAYLTCDGVLDSVFDSQVMGLIAELEKEKIKVDLYSARGPKRNFDPLLQEKISEVRSKLDGTFRQIWHLRYLGNWSTYFSRCSFSRNLDVSHKYRMVHCRGSYSGYVAVKSLGSSLPVLTDVRGVMVEEAGIRRGQVSIGNKIRNSGWRSRGLKSLERVAVEGAQAVTCVSNPLRGYLLRNYSIKPENVVVLPGCVDTSRFRPDEKSRDEVREKLKLIAKRVFLYVGSAKAWQIPEVIGKVFRYALEQDDRSHLLVLSQEPDVMRSFLEEEGIASEHMTIMQVAHEEIASYIRAADVGLLLREKSLVNEVACPTKFGEYVSSGVPVLASTGIGDTQAHIQEHRLGWLLDDFNDESQI
ncbi:MAG: glycosyltransferase, partial [Nitrospinaceae bacterium]|nr:glycosyltransferase [Nitrospinaceae bacterium]